MLTKKERRRRTLERRRRLEARYRAAKLCPCGREPRPGFKQCARCNDAGGAKYQIKYRPLDEVLGSTRVRLLRALTRFEWIDSLTLFEALGVPSWWTDDDRMNPERGAYTQMLSRITRSGLVERRRTIERGRCDGMNDSLEYRITSAGRAELASLLAYDLTAAWTDRDADRRAA